MAQYISKDALVAEIDRKKKEEVNYDDDSKSFASYSDHIHYLALDSMQDFIDTLEVIDPYEQCIQYSSVKDGIQAHAETYSFNIESKLFHQLTEEQQQLWRKEIEQAVISGGEMGVELARDVRYKENLPSEKKIEKELAEIYISIFDKKFGNKLPKLKSKQLADFKNFINTCEQTFSMKYFDYHATQGELFEKLALLWAVWGKEHLKDDKYDRQANNQSK